MMTSDARLTLKPLVSKLMQYAVVLRHADAALYDRDYKILQDALYNTLTPRVSDQQLMHFYGVTTMESLVDAMDAHITKLQAKVPQPHQSITSTPRQG